MGPLESRNDFAMVFFRKDFHPRRKLHPQISLAKNLALGALPRSGSIARARVKSKHLQQKVHQIGWFCLFELRMGPLESRNDLLWCFFARIFTLDESFTLKFHFEKSRPGRARVK